MSTDLTHHAIEELMPKLAAELASELSPPEEVLSRYGLSVTQFSAIAKTRQFKNLLQEAKATWNSDLNAKERIQAKATHLVEDGLLEMGAILHDRSKPIQARVDTFKHLSKMAKTDGGASDSQDVGERFAITINLGSSDDDKIVVEAPVVNTADIAHTIGEDV